MQAIQVQTTVTTIAAAGNRDFLHIQNVSDTDIYLKYDGSSTTLTASNGVKLAAGEWLILNNDGYRNVFRNLVQAIHGGSGDKEVRVQGA
jgi:hypothetical protein